MATMTPAQVSTLDPWQFDQLMKANQARLDPGERPLYVREDIEGGYRVWVVFRLSERLAMFYDRQRAYGYLDSLALAEAALCGEDEMAQCLAHRVLEEVEA